MKIFKLMIKGLHLILISFILILSCEKDDICIEGSENTKRITIGFLNNETKSPIGINLINVKSIDNDSIIHEQFSEDILNLPLKVNSNKTQFLLDNEVSIDTLTIYHQSIHQYLNRSCGFKANFIINSQTEITKQTGWIREISVIKDSIFNEEETNIFIHY